jgi:cell division initiation protein
MALTALDIQQQRFKARFGGGVDRNEVDAFLSLVANEFERLQRENGELREQERASRRIVDEYRTREDALKETMITAQRVTDDIKRAASKEAEIILGRAELEADKILERAQERLTDLLRDIGELKRQRAQLVSQLKATIEQHRALVAVAEDEGRHGLEENLAVLRKRTNSSSTQGASSSASHPSPSPGLADGRS